MGEIDDNGLPVASERQALEPALVAEVVAQSAIRVRSADELADLLIDAGAIRAVRSWRDFYDELFNSGRATYEGDVWLAVATGRNMAELTDDDEAIATLLRVHLAVAGPVSIEQLVSEDELGVGPLRGAPLSIPRARTA